MTEYFHIVTVFFAAIFLAVPQTAFSQELSCADMIAASQDGASPLMYKADSPEIEDIMPGTFFDESECIVRGGLPNFFGKMSEGENVTVAFIGGSITQGDYCYRLQISKFMEKKWPGVRFTWLNAGVSGTGTDLGAFRIGEQVLRHDPDLVFVEFAVNGAYAEGMEGIVRQIINNDSTTDICLIYTIKTGETCDYQAGGMPKSVQALEKVAEHYSLPSIHLGMEASALEKDGRLLWKGKKADGKILFSNDGIHPSTSGGNLYAAALARGLEKMSARDNPKPHLLPSEPVFGAKWDIAGMYIPSEIAEFDGNWKEVRTADRPELRKFSGWFDTVLTSYRKESVLHFAFEGDMFGLFDVGGPEVGQLEVLIDGELVKLKPCHRNGFSWFRTNDSKGDYTLNRFNRWCNNRHRGQHAVVEVPYGQHQVTLRISSVDIDKKTILDNDTDIDTSPEKYDRSVIYLGRILLRGKPIKTDRIKGVPKLKQQLKWDEKFARYERLDRENPPKDGVILFVGSSTIENWKTVADDFPGKYVLNRGVSGTKTIDMINYFDRLVAPYDPKQIFLYVGDNDIGYHWTPDEVMEQVARLFNMVRESKPDAEIVLISIKPSPRRLKDKERIEQTNALIKAFAESQLNSKYADIYTPMFGADGKLCPEHFREDRLHLTADGYKVWQKVISNYIK